MDVGDIAPDFELPDQHGTLTRLTDLLRHGTVVLFFYPAAMTKGCTAEACHFRDLSTEFAAAGAQPVGISPDPVEQQLRFDDAHSLQLRLLSDTERKVAREFGVHRKIGPLPVKRHTFVIGPDRTLRAVIRSEFDMSQHADEALAVISAV